MVRYATIGTSTITDKFIDGAERAGGLLHTAVYSRNESTGRAFANKHRVSTVFADLEQLAKSDAIDAVYIASPNSLHYAQAKLFLENKKHVLCEKLVAQDEGLVTELSEIAKENKVVFLEAIKSMFTPGAKILKEAVSKIGRVSQAQFSFLQLSSRYPQLIRGEIPNIFNPDLQAGALADIGVYCLHPAVYLFGRYKEICACDIKHTNGIDLCGDAILKYDGLNVCISYSKIANSFVPSYITGDKGIITIEKISEFAGITLKENDGTQTVLDVYNPNDNYMRFEAAFFRDAVSDCEKYREEILKLNRQTALVCGAVGQIKAALN